MRLRQRIFQQLIYWTPIGYVLSTIEMVQGERVRGVHFDMLSNAPFTVRLTEKPSTNDRWRWLINGLILLGQGLYIVARDLAGDLGGAYALAAIVYGGICMVSSIFPNIKWERKLF